LGENIVSIQCCNEHVTDTMEHTPQQLLCMSGTNSYIRYTSVLCPVPRVCTPWEARSGVTRHHGSPRHTPERSFIARWQRHRLVVRISLPCKAVLALAHVATWTDGRAHLEHVRVRRLSLHLAGHLGGRTPWRILCARVQVPISLRHGLSTHRHEVQGASHLFRALLSLAPSRHCVARPFARSRPTIGHEELRCDGLEVGLIRPSYS
jgi:hypothetical protein